MPSLTNMFLTDLPHPEDLRSFVYGLGWIPEHSERYACLQRGVDWLEAVLRNPPGLNVPGLTWREARQSRDWLAEEMKSLERCM